MFESLWWLSVVFTVLVDFFIAYIVYKNNPRSATNKILSLTAIILLFWDVSNFLALSLMDQEARLFWVRVVMFVTSPLGPLIFMLSSVFPEEKLILNKKLLYVTIFSVVATSLLAISPFTFRALENLPGGSFKLFPGPAILIYGFNLFFFLSWGFIILFKKLKKSSGILRKQLTLFAVGTVSAFTLMVLTNFVAVVVFKSIKFTFLGPSFTLIMVGFIAYAIIRHKLLNIKVIASELLVISLVLILLSKLFLFKTIGEFIVDIIVFTFVLIFSYLLVKSVSREVEQREKLQELTEKLKALDKQKDEFISMAAHELRAPMTAIKGYLSMIMEGDAGKVPDKICEFLRGSVEGNDRLIRLVNNMLNVGRIEEGRMVYQMGNVLLKDIIKDTYNEFKGEAEAKNIIFNFDSTKNLVDKVYVDKDRIYEVITNLASNSIKYTDKGSVSIKLSNPKVGLVRCEIVDTGRGITEDEQKKLFQKFGRAESSSGKTIGSGLGLYISKLLIEKFGGNIGLISESGKGSTFWFELPVV